MSCSTAELMSLVMARSLRDGDTMITGTNAAITRTATFVAQRCGKPNVRTVIGSTGTLDPSVWPTPPSGGDEAFLAGRMHSSLATVVGDQVRGLADVMCLGGLQVDRRGGINLAVVGGEFDRPKLRGPGTVGVSLVGLIDRTFLYFLHHDARTFVEEVDFLGGEGLRPDGRGIQVVVTPLAVLGPVEDGSRLDLLSVHPGVEFERVREQTGFELDPARAKPTPPPSEAEQAALRAAPDAGTLKTMELPG
jgi:glutaconate CoA-transferase subunit B